MINVSTKFYIIVTQLVALSFLIVNMITGAFEANIYTYVRFLILFTGAFYFYFLPERTSFGAKVDLSMKSNIIISKLVGLISATVNICTLIAFYFHV